MLIMYNVLLIEAKTEWLVKSDRTRNIKNQSGFIYYWTQLTYWIIGCYIRVDCMLPGWRRRGASGRIGAIHPFWIETGNITSSSQDRLKHTGILNYLFLKKLNLHDVDCRKWPRNDALFFGFIFSALAAVVVLWMRCLQCPSDGPRNPNMNV